MSEQPKAGEWWWVETASVTDKVWAMKRTDDGYWRNGSGIFAQREIRPIARISDPPVPEPTEAEKVDARRVGVIREWWQEPWPQRSFERLSGLLRASDEAAGYVLVPTSGPEFERMVRDAKRATVYRGDIYSPATAMVEEGIRAFLEAAKGDAR